MRRRARSPGTAFASLLLIFIGFRLYRADNVRPPSPPSPNVEFVGDDSPRSSIVKRVVDGDTLLLDTEERVRLIGVDTPETKHPDLPVDPLGLDAAAFVKQRVEGRMVELRFDRERFDPHQRLLAYVYIDGECLNEEIIRAGFSKAITRFPYRSSQKVIFIKAENEAKKAKRNIWAAIRR